MKTSPSNSPSNYTAASQKSPSFSDRIKATRPTRWIRFALVTLLFLAWVAWMQRWWLAVFVILLFDIYITGYIPFTWWKKSKNPAVRGIMSWVDAIVYALSLVYCVFAFVGQNYQIPSGSLEKTLLTGDYLWVNKMVYGPRVPMTPVHFPLVTRPFLLSQIHSSKRAKKCLGIRKRILYGMMAAFVCLSMRPWKSCEMHLRTKVKWI